MRNFLLLTLIAIFLGNGAYSQSTLDTAGVEKILGRKGTLQGDVFKFTFPRSDLNVSVNGIHVEPGLALTSWVAMIKSRNQTMMMGDLVLLDAELTNAITKLVASGLEVTAIHNHLINETPAIKYVHYFGQGDELKLAEAIKSILAVTGTPLTRPATKVPSTTPDWSMVQSVLGTGKQNGDLLQYNFPRNEKTMDHGMEIPPAMGTATAINFQMNGNQAAIAGDFVLLAGEVNVVVKTLTENGISITAIHNHMLYDDPRLFMMHFWAVGEPVQLAKGLKATLDKINVRQ